MEEGSLSRTLEFNYRHSYTQEEYAMKRNNTHFYECTSKNKYPSNDSFPGQHRQAGIRNVKPFTTVIWN